MVTSFERSAFRYMRSAFVMCWCTWEIITANSLLQLRFYKFNFSFNFLNIYSTNYKKYSKPGRKVLFTIWVFNKQQATVINGCRSYIYDLGAWLLPGIAVQYFLRISFYFHSVPNCNVYWFVVATGLLPEQQEFILMLRFLRLSFIPHWRAF